MNNRMYEQRGFTPARAMRTAAIIAGFAVLWAHGQCLVEEKAVATGQQVSAFLKQSDPTCTGNAKLVYINGCGYSGKLRYIDYSGAAGAPTVQTIAAAGDEVRVPVISPDGGWVTYAVGSGAEGHLSGGPSSAYICKLDANATPVKIADNAHEPRFKLNQADPNMLTVIYGTVGGEEAWTKTDPGQTMQVDIDVSSGAPSVGSPSPLFAHAAMFGGLSWDNRYLASAGGLGAMVDLQSGKTTVDTISLRFARKGSNDDWPAGIDANTVLSASQAAEMNLLGQTCNTSVSSSRSPYTNAMIGLDFGSSKVNPNINGGAPWGKWQIMWVFAYDGSVPYHLPVPTDDEDYPYAQGWPTDYQHLDSAIDLATTRWHHTEWSNHPYFATASVILKRGWGFENGTFRGLERQERVYLIDLDNSSTLCLLSPTDNNIIYEESISNLSYPGLWVEMGDGFEECANWLSAEVSCAASSVRDHGPRGITVGANGIVSRLPIRTAELFLPNGALVKRIAARGATSIDTRDLTPRNSAASTYILRLTATNGATIVVPRLIAR
jgi:hypothetical protein